MVYALIGCRALIGLAAVGLAAVGLVAGCGPAVPGSDELSGTVVIVSSGDADVLFPPATSTTIGRQVTESIFDYLAAIDERLIIGDDKQYRPQLATRWQWAADSLSISYHLDSLARWHDGKAVTAADVAFTFRVYTDPRFGSSTGGQLGNITAVTAADSLTAVFHFRRRDPLQFFDATNQMQILPRHIYGAIPPDSLRKIASKIAPVGSGRYRFVRWNKSASIELTADTSNYRGAPKIRRLIWSVTPSAITASTRLLAGEADIYETMRPENVREAAIRPNIRIITAPSTDYVFLQFNLMDGKRQNRAHPILASRELRRALTFAVDIPAMVRNVFDSLAQPGIGPTIRAYPTTDTTVMLLPHDPARAVRTLDSLGWRLKGQSEIRERNGQKLRFTILVPASSLNRHKMGVMLQAQFRKVGVAVDLDEVEFSTFGQRAQSRDFDAYLGNWHLGASAAAVKETWTSAAATAKSGLNYGSYMNPLFDAYADSATSTMDPLKSRLYYRKAYQTAIDDAPAIWLYEPRMVIGIHKRIKIGPIRPDAWWSSLPDWEIQRDNQIARDRIQ